MHSLHETQESGRKELIQTKHLGMAAYQHTAARELVARKSERFHNKTRKHGRVNRAKNLETNVPTHVWRGIGNMN
jgi:hypothetical protein